MRHKVLHIALAIISLGMLMTSCKDFDIDEPQTLPDDGLLSDREMQFAITFKYKSGASTRADDPNADPGERFVNNVRVVLYEGKQIEVDGMVQPDPDAEVLYCFDYYIRSTFWYEGFQEWGGTWPDDPSDPLYTKYPQGEHLYKSLSNNEFITYARKVDDRNYYMLVILNTYLERFWDDRIQARADGSPTWDDRMRTRADGDPLATRFRELTEVGRKYREITQPIPLGRDDIGNPFAGGPAVNEYYLMTNANGLVYVPSTKLGSSVENAHEHPIATEVERAVAKVEVTMDDNLTLPPKAAIGKVSWDLVNTNKFFYWMRKQTNLITASGAVGDHECVTAPDAQRVTVYAEDPNFSGLSTAAGGTVAQRRTQFNTVEEIYQGQSPTSLMYSAEAGNWGYALENTMSADDQSPEVITQAVLAMAYNPDTDVYTFDNDWYPTMLNEGYFIYNNVRVSIAQMQSYANGAPITDPALDGLADAIDAVQNDLSITLDLTNIVEDYNNEPFDEYGLKYYRYGVCYYNVLIKHYNNDPMDGYGRYGIVRNNYYKINITEISGPGSPVINRPVYISAEIDMMDWLVNKQEEEDLGEEVGDLNKKPIVTIRYIYQDFGYYDNDRPATRAGRLEYGPHEKVLHTEYVRYNVGDVITDDDMAIRNRYKDWLAANVIGRFRDGESYNIPMTVSADNRDNEITVFYYQDFAAVLVYYYDKDDPSINLWYDIFWGESNYLEVPHGYTVNADTPHVRFRLNWLGEEEYYDFSPYTYDSSDPVGGVTANADVYPDPDVDPTTNILRLYYTKPVSGRRAMVRSASDGSSEAAAHTPDKDYGNAMDENIIPYKLPVDENGEASDYSGRPVAGSPESKAPYLEGKDTVTRRPEFF